MSFWDSIKDMILGCKLIAVDDVAVVVESALSELDVNKDGYVSVRELISVFKKALKRY